MAMNKTFKDLVDKINETANEIKQVANDTEVAYLVIKEQHYNRKTRKM